MPTNDGDEQRRRTTATRRITSRPGCDSVADLDPLRHPITPPLPGRKPRPERVVRRRGDAKAPAIPAGQPEQFSRAAALTTVSSGGWWGLFLPRLELSAGARREEDMMIPTLIRTVPSGGPSLAWSVTAPPQTLDARTEWAESGEALVVGSRSRWRPRVDTSSLVDGLC